MEADWAIEVGEDAARIEADWAGFVDLRQNAALVDQVAETREHPPLRAALLELNGAQSPVFTSKCDVWELAAEEIDPLEFDCAADEGRMGLATYVDLTARDGEGFASFAAHEAWVRRAALALRENPLPQGRVDLVARGATAGGLDGFGVTLYAAGCGVDSRAAEAAWGEILRAAVVATMREAPGNTGRVAQSDRAPAF